MNPFPNIHGTIWGINVIGCVDLKICLLWNVSIWKMYVTKCDLRDDPCDKPTKCQNHHCHTDNHYQLHGSVVSLIRWRGLLSKLHYKPLSQPLAIWYWKQNAWLAIASWLGLRCMLLRYECLLMSFFVDRSRR